MIPDLNNIAYGQCVELARKNDWRATYFTLVEDGYDPTIDWITMYEEWSQDATANKPIKADVRAES